MKQKSQLEKSSWQFQWAKGSLRQSSHFVAFRVLFNTKKSLDLNMQTLKKNIFNDLLAKIVDTLYLFIQYCPIFFSKIIFINNCISRDYCITVYITEILVTSKRIFSGPQFLIRYIQFLLCFHSIWDSSQTLGQIIS